MKCCEITPARLRHSIEIRELVETEDALGGQVSEWVTIKTVKASVDPMSGNERLRAMQLNATLTHRVLLRYFDGLTAKHQIKFGERLFQIRSVINIEERNRFYELSCDEGVAQ